MDKEISRDTILISFFGALWGLMEITLGTALKGLKLPFAGEVLTSGATIIALTGRYFVNQKGSVLLMGLVAAVIKIFSLGNVIIGPFMAIIFEALMAEIIVSVFKLNLFTYCFTGAMLQLYTVIHPLVAQGIIYGQDIYKIYIEMFEQFSVLLGLSTYDLMYIIIIYVILHMSIGVVAGFLGWKLTLRVEEKLYKSHG